MGKIIKDGFHFMEYANSGLIRKIDDIPELKNKLIEQSELKTHMQMSQYALLLAEHILDIASLAPFTEIEECFSVIREWQNKKATVQEALQVAGMINDLAREEKSKPKAKALRALGQVAATPHVRWHPLVASEYAVVVINLLYPENHEKVKQERMLQIEMMNSV